MNSFERIDAAVALEVPDRVPLAPLLDHWAATYTGITNAELMSDAEKRIQAVLRTATDFNWDMTFVAETAEPTLLRIGVSARLQMPGEELPPDSVHQFVETKCMEAEDYDLLAREGLMPFTMTLISRIYPEIGAESILEQMRNTAGEINEHLERVRQAGIAPAVGFVMPGTGFERFSLARGIVEISKDLRRRPDKIKAAGMRFSEDFLNLALGAVARNGIKRVFIGLSRSSPSFIAPKYFEELVLPELELIVNRLIEEGITPLFHCDTDWTLNLHHFANFPRGKCIMELDSFTDIFNAKQILGDTMVIMGDVPSTLLATGTKDEVLDYCRRLIREVGAGGGLILSSGCSIPNNAKPENITAMTEAVEEWGYY